MLCNRALTGQLMLPFCCIIRFARVIGDTCSFIGDMFSDSSLLSSSAEAVEAI